MMQRIAGFYELHEKLGQGGMGEVFRATDTRTSATVAIKQLKPHIAQPDVIERFQREGEALRALHHPNIVKMLDAVEENGNHYLVMEYVAGGDLATLLRQGKMPVEHVLKLAIDLADALTRAHKLNIIHRDLKPANILTGEDGVLRLTDFGVAHVGSKARVTDTDAIVGTLDYLPPEAFSGGTLDARGDIWGFGVMLYEMLAGQRPFPGNTVVEVIYAITTQSVPDLETLCPDTPVALVDLIYRMLEKDPQARIPSVRVIGAELEAILEGRYVTPGLARFGLDTPDFLSRPKHNLPAQTTAFVGREPELAELARLLNAPDVRLISILAPGGMGKTRLALESAKRHLNAFQHGVYLVDLTPLSNPNTIIPALAESINIPVNDEDKRSPKQQVLDFLENKQMLLVIDNWEHLIEAAALVTDILEAASGVQILATSRQRLEQASETVFHLAGMDFPDWETPKDALDYAAVKLFMNSAMRIQPTFELASDNLNYIARICRLVGGMPLGIVLAASWLGMLSPEEIAREIASSIGFLEATGSEVPDRQRSIQVVFDYSWQMMGADEQRIFMQMSIFKGGFTRQAVQAISAAHLRLLMSLVNKSVIRRDIDSGRYHIHELLRQYAANRLAADTQLYQATCRAHCDYYLQMLAERTPWLKGSKQVQAVEDIENDFENVRSAWFYAAEQGWFDLLAQCREALEIFTSKWKTPEDVHILWDVVWQACQTQPTKPVISAYIEASQAKTQAELDTLIAAAQQNDDIPLLRHAYYRSILLSSDRRDYAGAFGYAAKNLETARQENDPFHLGQAYYQFGFYQGSTGDLQGWLENVNKSHQIFEQHHNRIGLGYCLSAMVSKSVFMEGNYQQAYDYAQQMVDIWSQFRFSTARAFALCNVVTTGFFLGRFEEGRRLLEQVIGTDEALHDTQTHALLEVLLAYDACLARRYDEAKTRASASIQLTTNLSVVANASVILCWAAASAKAPLGDQIKRGITLTPIERIELIAFTNFYLPAIAHDYAQHGKASYAVEICSIATHHPRSPVKLFEVLPILQDLIGELRTSITPDEFTAAWERGTHMEFAPVVRRFLDEHG